MVDRYTDKFKKNRNYWTLFVQHSLHDYKKTVALHIRVNVRINVFVYGYVITLQASNNVVVSLIML